jgi:hypothetical protein
MPIPSTRADFTVQRLAGGAGGSTHVALDSRGAPIATLMLAPRVDHSDASVYLRTYLSDRLGEAPPRRDPVEVALPFDTEAGDRVTRRDDGTHVHYLATSGGASLSLTVDRRANHDDAPAYLLAVLRRMACRPVEANTRGVLALGRRGPLALVSDNDGTSQRPIAHRKRRRGPTGPT